MQAAFSCSTIQEDCTLAEVLNGTVIVMHPATVTLTGHLTQHLTILPGATVHLYGRVDGTVSNQGGTLYIYGKVQGALELDGGKTIIDAHSYIRRIASGRRHAML